MRLIEQSNGNNTKLQYLEVKQLFPTTNTHSKIIQLAFRSKYKQVAASKCV